jgi:hypothetical protein
MADDPVVEEVGSWFQTRGFALTINHADGVWWAKLISINNPDFVAERYGRGATAEAAALRARERWSQEQAT